MDQPVLTAEILFKITQELNWRRLKRNLPDLDGKVHYDEVKVTWEDIEDTADSLKFNAFYVPTIVYMEAARLARERGCWRESENFNIDKYFGQQP
jgi:hypothetical protein